MDEEFRREIIMENYMHPKNRRDAGSEYIKTNTRNASCIDNLDIFIKFKGDVIEDISFMGEACAISISSTSIMINNLIGKTKEEALEYIDNFYKMTDGLEYDEELLGEAVCYSDIHKQGNRKTCATLPYRGIKEVILKSLEN